MGRPSSLFVLPAAADVDVDVDVVCLLIVVVLVSSFLKMSRVAQTFLKTCDCSCNGRGLLLVLSPSHCGWSVPTMSVGQYH